MLPIENPPPSVSGAASKLSVSIGAASKLSVNASQSTAFVITYTGAASISLSDTDVSLIYTGTASDCAIAVSGAGLSTRTVTLSSCDGDGSVRIGIAAHSALDDASNQAPAAGPSGAVNVNNPRFVSLSTGKNHTCGISSDGKAYCWGSDDYGKLGDGGTNTDKPIPTPVDTTNLNGASFVSLSLGWDHTCGIASDKKAYCWGWGFFGQLGDGGGNYDKPIPTPVDTSALSAGSSFVSLAAGSYHTCGIASDGKAFCWGRDASGRLGDGGANTDKPIPTPVDTNHLNGASFVSLSTGWHHTCGIASDGKAYCWGPGGYGRLGDGGTNTSMSIPTLVDTSALSAGSSFVSLSTGYNHTCGIASDGKAYCWGWDFYGQLGDGGGNYDKPIPTPVDTINLNGASFVSLALGAHHTCGIASGKKAYCWGWGQYGQLGDGGFAIRSTIPTLVNTSALSAGSSFLSLSTGYNHTCGIASDGKAYCWGSDEYGQLGDDTIIADKLFPTAVETMP